MGRFFVDDANPIWWHLGRIVQIKNTRVWETQDRIGTVQNEVSLKKAGPDCHRLKTRVKRSIEQNFEARNGNYERNAVVKNQGTKQREQRTLGYCWQWKANGQCCKGDKCSFRHDMNKRAKSTSFSELFFAAEWRKCIENQKSQWQKSQWKNVSIALQGLLQRNLHQFILWKNGIFQYACSTSGRMDADLDKSALTCTARLKNSPAKGLNIMMTKVQWLCWKGMSSIKEQGDLFLTLTHQVHDNWVACFRIWSCRSLHRFCGRAQTYGNQSDV